MIESKRKTVLLEARIEDLNLEKGLIELLLTSGYKNLKEVLDLPVYQMRKKIGMTIDQELELFKYVEAKGLEEFWKEK